MTETVYLPNLEEFKKYINNLMKDYNVSQQDLANETGLDRTVISKMIGKRRKSKAQIRHISYEEAESIVNALMKMISPFQKDTVKKIRTKHKTVSKFGIVKMSEKISVAAEIMAKRGYTQLLVEDNEGHYVGILTDFALLNRMLHPKEMSKDWLNKLKNQTIGESKLCEEAALFSIDDNPMLIAQALTYHYAVLIKEGGNYGIITRNDFTKVLRDSFSLTYS